VVPEVGGSIPLIHPEKKVSWGVDHLHRLEYNFGSQVNGGTKAGTAFLLEREFPTCRSCGEEHSGKQHQAF
jgi:hypothetical protein